MTIFELHGNINSWCAYKGQLCPVLPEYGEDSSGCLLSVLSAWARMWFWELSEQNQKLQSQLEKQPTDFQGPFVSSNRQFRQEKNNVFAAKSQVRHTKVVFQGFASSNRSWKLAMPFFPGKWLASGSFWLCGFGCCSWQHCAPACSMPTASAGAAPRVEGEKVTMARRLPLRAVASPSRAWSGQAQQQPGCWAAPALAMVWASWARTSTEVGVVTATALNSKIRSCTRTSTRAFATSRYGGCLLGPPPLLQQLMSFSPLVMWCASLWLPGSEISDQ